MKAVYSSGPIRINRLDAFKHVTLLLSSQPLTSEEVELVKEGASKVCDLIFRGLVRIHGGKDCSKYIARPSANAVELDAGNGLLYYATQHRYCRGEIAGTTESSAGQLTQIHLTGTRTKEGTGNIALGVKRLAWIAGSKVDNESCVPLTPKAQGEETFEWVQLPEEPGVPEG